MKKRRELKIKFLKNAKIKSRLFKVLYVFIFICIFYNMIFVINTTITKKNYFSFFGMSMFSIRDNLMKPEIGKNEWILTKNVKQQELKVDDVIAYTINGSVRINKIINIKNKDGKIVYVTKSNQNYYPDIEQVNPKQIIGKMVVHISGLGFMTHLLETKIFTLFAIIILLLRFSYNRYIYKTKQIRRGKAKLRN